MTATDLYTPLSEAVAELHERRRDAPLCAKVANFYRDHPPRFMEGGPYACLTRPIITADNEIVRFLDLVRTSGLPARGLSIIRDRFCEINPEKVVLLRLPFLVRHQVRRLNIVGQIYSGVTFGDITCRNGMSLVAFHRQLLEYAHPDFRDHVHDFSDWMSLNDGHFDYERYLPLFVTYGVLFETFGTDEEETRFTHERVIPAFEKVQRIFGLRPLIVRLFSDEEVDDPKWWRYPDELFPVAKEILHNPPSIHEKKYSWLHPALKVASDSSCDGKGVFATRSVEKGTLLAIFGGHVMRLEEEPAFSDGCEDLAIQIHDDFVFGAMFPHEIEDADFLNHSCSPNAGIHGQIFIVAMRDINDGEQICFDYAMAVSKPGYRFECHCGAPNCRGVITGEDWKLPELQARYDGYFQWYLQQKIRAVRDEDSTMKALERNHKK